MLTEPVQQLLMNMIQHIFDKLELGVPQLIWAGCQKGSLRAIDELWDQFMCQRLEQYWGCLTHALAPESQQGHGVFWLHFSLVLITLRQLDAFG